MRGEGPAAASGPVAVLAAVAHPVFEEPEGVVPERVDLHRLTAPGRDDPVVHLGVHPGELVALGTLAQQAVRGIDADAEPGAAQVVIDDVEEDRQEMVEGLPVAGGVEVA